MLDVSAPLLSDGIQIEVCLWDISFEALVLLKRTYIVIKLRIASNENAVHRNLRASVLSFFNLL